MFHNARKDISAASTVNSSQLHDKPARRLRAKVAQPSDASREAFVDPVHGRHCICNRCAQHRTA
jgi:hypothetical protein